MTKTDEVQSVLDRCTIEGNNVFLPEDLNRDVYVKVNKKLIGIGGKWNRKAKAHVFLTDPSELMGRVQKGEDINLKKDFQFFETPPELADKLVELAIHRRHTKDIQVVLEPSAGQGRIIDAIHRWQPKLHVYACELMGTNTVILKQKYNQDLVCVLREADFLSIKQKNVYDTVIANPPFSKNQDIFHVAQMFDVCKVGGRIVSIVSDHWRLSDNSVEKAFGKWLEYLGAEVIPIEKGAFKSSGTNVGGNIIVINKQ